MAHGITNEAEMLYNNQNGLPWHRLGIPMDGLSTAQDVFDAIPRFAEPLEKVQATFEGEPVKNAYWIVEGNTRKIVSKGTVGAEYEILQRTDLVRMMAELVLDPNGPNFETAMLLWDGQKEVLQARIPQEIVIKGRNGQADVLHAYVVGSNGTSERAKFGTGMRRVVCQNTEAMFFNEADKNTSTWFVHSGDLQAKMNRVQDILGLVAKDAEETAELYQALARCEPTAEQIETVMNRLIPKTVSKRGELQRERVLQLASGGRGNAEWAGTAWGLYNGFTELEDWHANAGSKREDADDMRTNNILFGSGMARKQEALKTIAGVCLV